MKVSQTGLKPIKVEFFATSVSSAPSAVKSFFDDGRKLTTEARRHGDTETENKE
jgi:hypothetical protein